MTNTLLVSIDPDVSKSGFAVIVTGATEFYELTTLPFFEMLDRIQQLNLNAGGVEVYIEAAWLIAKSNWHGGKSMGVAAKIGKAVGANHQVGRLLEEFCIHYQIPYKLIKPSDSKKDAKYFEQVTKYKLRTNQEMRDAGMLIWGR